MRENKLRKFLTIEEMEEKVYSKGYILKEDIEFFTMYLNRNKKSNFNFDIIPTQGMCSKLTKKLWESCYYSQYKNDIHIFLTEVEVVRKIMKTLDDDSYKEEDIKEVYDYFNNYYEIDLCEYIGDFIGCSRSCGVVERRIRESLHKM